MLNINLYLRYKSLPTIKCIIKSRCNFKVQLGERCAELAACPFSALPISEQKAMLEFLHTQKVPE